MTITRLTGGLTPANGSDPRTFPTIWNSTADDLERGFRLVETVYFTSNGTFTKATYPWLRAIRVKVVGGGGGGGSCDATGATQFAGSSGGGGGACAEIFITDIAGLDASVNVICGAGGNGGAAGVNDGLAGGTSTFGLTDATGGLGGLPQVGRTAVDARTGGQGGGASGTFDIAFPGQAGSPGFAISTTAARNIGGTGGASGLGAAGAAGNNDRDSDPANGTAPGVGGGGAGKGLRPNQAASAGGNGANGIVIVELYA
jgi:hypothetical protein